LGIGSGYSPVHQFTLSQKKVSQIYADVHADLRRGPFMITDLRASAVLISVNLREIFGLKAVIASSVKLILLFDS
jgi:hypothetical protein